MALQCYQIGAVPWLVAQSDNLRYRLLTEVPADYLRKRPCHAEAITRITGNTLLDEKILGTVHIALGDNRTFGGTNNASIHWDLVIQSPTVTVGETVLMDDGRLLV